MLTRLLTVLSVCLLFTGAASAQSKTSPEAGNFIISGTTPEGQALQGALYVRGVANQPRVMVVTGHFETPFRGLGYSSRSMFAVAYGSSVCSVAMYVLNGDALEGEWVPPQLDGTRVQTGRRDPASADSYLLTSQNGGSSVQSGGLALRATGDTMQVEMTLDGTQHAGTGIWLHDVLSVVYGDASCRLSTYDVEDGELGEGRDAAWGAEAASVVEGAVPDVRGRYTVEGENPDGSTYVGTATLRALDRVHTLEWEIGESIYQGTALMRGSLLAVGYGGERCGVAAFNVTLAGHLDGTVTQQGLNTFGQMLAQRDAPATGGYAQDITGRYTLDASTTTADPRIDALANMHTMTVARWAASEASDMYEVVWETASGERVVGTGIYRHSTLSVGFGGETCGIAVYELDGAALRGTWANVGADSFGREVLVHGV